MARFQLLIIGDEILSGRRRDRHFAAAQERLAARGHRIASAHYLPDDPLELEETFRRTLAAGVNVIAFGGIGATPDDHTRPALARAAGVPLRQHPEAARLIHERFGEAALPYRIHMAEFAEGSTLIPNPVNQVAGAWFRQHALLPGFPEMAWPMLEWVLDTHFEVGEPDTCRTLIVPDAREGELVGLMEEVVLRNPGVAFSSLPSYGNERHPGPHIEFSVTGSAEATAKAMRELQDGLASRQLPARLPAD
ncbi:competence/damage-inducible protein A [Chitinilyticum piscinae]|uniref:Competence/damage-inducible protein A n=1 Tax=Chitinilyticum piscinae TaxID=2866724 RepID=A0A8J7G267_9NEIS|nr:molybdopterin-binding protein [Chitinilyticum piscinae]MBE9610028.1 competence/damage-inducible protein A [Chitinilyticum piscinae]